MTQPRILIVDDDPAIVEMLTIRCRFLGLAVAAGANAMEAVDQVREFHPDLICLDLHMPGQSGFDVCELLALGDQSQRVPVIIMTGDVTDETIRRCYNLSAFYVEKCPDLWPRLEPLLCELLHLEQSVPAMLAPSTPTDGKEPIKPKESSPIGECVIGTGSSESRLMGVVFEMLADDHRFLEDGALQITNDPPWILCIDDDSDYSIVLKRRLESHGIAVVRAFEGREGLRCAFSRPADVVLLDYEMPNGRGDYILGRLKDNAITRDIPVIVITGRNDRRLEQKMTALGAAKFMTKPPDFQQLLTELRKHIKVLAEPASEYSIS